MKVSSYSELNASLLLTDLGDYDIILGYPWLKENGVSINCKTDTQF